MAYFTEVGSSGHVIACVHATDRLTYPGEPLFNEETVPERVSFGGEKSSGGGLLAFDGNTRLARTPYAFRLSKCWC